MIETYKSKYNYQNYNIKKINGIRYYQINDNLSVPSVTSILNLTKAYSPSTSRRINISNSNPVIIGKLMHKYLDYYISRDRMFYDSDKNFFIAKGLAKIIIDNCISDIDEIWGAEASVYYKKRYAGTIDLIGMMDNKLIIVDYKSSSRKKTPDEIEEYFLQLAAYNLAHDWQYKTKVDSIMIFLCMRDGAYEKKVVSFDELEKYQNKWLERLTLFEEQAETND